jgi:hypothetical protein
MFSNFNSINLFDIFIIFQNIHYYLKSIEKLVKGHLERAVIEFDKLAAPLFPIKLSL